jgi:ferrochelatase
MMKKGILLVNLGTPSDCDTKSVKRYLRQLLLDARVVDIPFLIRYALINFVILPFRVKSSQEAYQKIWQTESPLFTHSMNLKKALSDVLSDDYQVEFGMRYGEPSIQSALSQLSNCDHLTILPLYPQYSSAATGSALDLILKLISKQNNIPELHVINHFYHDPGYISVYAKLIKKHLTNHPVDRVLFSYHGLPERHLTKSDCVAPCDRISDCPLITKDNSFCYRAQCFTTSQLLANELGLQRHQYLVAFQSRLGRTPWVKPYTDFVLPQLIQSGIKNIAVVCPSFVADCVETLEEINLRAREQWQLLGGEHFTFIPCLNSEPDWVSALSNRIRRIASY